MTNIFPIGMHEIPLEDNRMIEPTRLFCELIAAKLELPNPKISEIDREFYVWLQGDTQSNNPLLCVRKLIEIIQKYPTSGINNATLTYFLQRVSALPIGKYIPLKHKLCEFAETDTLDGITIESLPFIFEGLRTFDLGVLSEI